MTFFSSYISLSLKSYFIYVSWFDDPAKRAEGVMTSCLVHASCCRLDKATGNVSRNQYTKTGPLRSSTLSAGCSGKFGAHCEQVVDWIGNWEYCKYPCHVCNPRRYSFGTKSLMEKIGLTLGTQKSEQFLLKMKCKTFLNLEISSVSKM